MVPPIPALVSLLALLVFQAATLIVGQARAAHGVKAPATTGPEPFERALRVQQNTLEQLVFFLPAFWLAVLLDNPTIASALGLIWVGGRIAYAVGYLQAPEKRGPGFGISFLSSAVLLVMAVVGAVRSAL
ncbi:MAPEG family protein [Synechococcus sp. CCY 9618]|uniref:MAPEG family protein n=1 Tax=Synechococcus sp. CCY 9618 TaxID=2815602 RepID=UPI001C23FCC3|nr:MAPEG family protein [Synechococcus sp. CCY 9618]